MAPGQERDVVGISPEQMQALIGQLAVGRQAIAAFAAEFSAPLAAQGISMSAVHQAEQWTADQVPKLTELLRKFRDDQPPRAASTPAGSGNSAPPASAGPTASAAAPRNARPAGSAGHSGGAGGSYPAGPPGSYGPALPAGAHPAARPATDVRQHATLDAKRVSSADHPNLAERAWDDIERRASDPQYAAAFLAALGAAGLAVLGAALARRRKQDKDDAQAARRQAVLDELTRAARQHPGTAESFPPPMPADPGRPDHGDQAPAAPRLRLVAAPAAPAAAAAEEAGQP